MLETFRPCFRVGEVIDRLRSTLALHAFNWTQDTHEG